MCLVRLWNLDYDGGLRTNTVNPLKEDDEMDGFARKPDEDWVTYIEEPLIEA